MSDYTLEVVLADLPRGWAVSAIGEGKPVAAPPPVLDEIRQLRAERDEALQELDNERHVSADTAKALFEARAQLAELQARKCGRFIWKDTAGSHFCNAPLGHAGDCGVIIELRC